MFGFEHTSERHSMSSSYGPGGMEDEMTYMHHADGLKDRGRDQSEQIIAASVAPQMMAVKSTVIPQLLLELLILERSMCSGDAGLSYISLTIVFLYTVFTNSFNVLLSITSPNADQFSKFFH